MGFKAIFFECHQNEFEYTFQFNREFFPPPVLFCRIIICAAKYDENANMQSVPVSRNALEHLIARLMKALK